MLKKCKVVMLPTNEKANSLKGYLDLDLLFKFQKEYKTISAEKNITGHFHLYFLSDDKIEKGDWLYNHYSSKAVKFSGEPNHFLLDKNCKKIIATTDTSLFTHQRETPSLPERVFYLPQPSQQFIEKYIEEYNKDNIFTDVMIEYENNNLKINPKDNTITIKRIKDNWNKEEVIEICKKVERFINENKSTYTEIPNWWLEENI